MLLGCFAVHDTDIAAAYVADKDFQLAVLGGLDDKLAAAVGGVLTYPQLAAAPSIIHGECVGRCIVAVAVIGSEVVETECRNDNLAKHGGDSHIGIHVDFYTI